MAWLDKGQLSESNFQTNRLALFSSNEGTCHMFMWTFASYWFVACTYNNLMLFSVLDGLEEPRLGLDKMLWIPAQAVCGLYTYMFLINTLILCLYLFNACWSHFLSLPCREICKSWGSHVPVNFMDGLSILSWHLFVLSQWSGPPWVTSPALKMSIF